MEIICEACGVRIVDGVVHYSYGKPKDLEHLAQKVCQFKKVNKPCANSFYDSDKEYCKDFGIIDWPKLS